MKKIVGLGLEINPTKGTVKELAEVELRLQGIRTELRKAKKEGDGKTYAKLREEQIKTQQVAGDLRKEIRQQVKDFKAAKFPTDSIEGLRLQYRKLRREIDGLSEADPNFDKLSKQAEQLSNRINTLKKNTGDFTSNIGRYEESVTSAIQSTTDLLSGNATSLIAGLGPAGAVAAGVDLLAQGIQVVGDLSKEFVVLRGNVQTLSNVTGEELDRVAAQVGALSDTFTIENEEIAKGVAEIQNQLGVSAGQAGQLLEQSLLAVADPADLLSRTQDELKQLTDLDLPPDSAMALLVEASNRNINIDVLAEPLIRLREATPATVQALEGAFGREATEQLFNTFRERPLEAIQEISTRLGDLPPRTEEVGAVLADVFSASGEDAIATAKSLDTLQTSLADLIDPTNELTQSRQRALEVNKEAARAQNDLAKELGSVDGTLANVGTQIKTVLIDFVVLAIRRGKELFEIFRPLIDSYGRLFKALGLVNVAGQKTSGVLKVIGQIASVQRKILEFLVQLFAKVGDGITRYVNLLGSVGRRLGILKEQSVVYSESVENVDTNLNNLKETINNLGSETDTTEQSTEKLRGTLDKVNNLSEVLSKTSIAFLQKKLSELNEDLQKSPNETVFSKISSEIAQVEKQLTETQAKFQQFKDAQTGVTQTLEILPTIGGTDNSALIDDALTDLGISPQQLAQDAELEDEEEHQQLLKELRERGEKEQTELMKNRAAERRMILEEDLKKKQEVFTSVSQEAQGVFTQFLEQGNLSFKEFQKALLKTALKAIANRVRIASVEILAQEISQKSFFGAITAGILVGVVNGAFSALQSKIESFAFGGVVDGVPALTSGRITASPNVPRQPSGDNVLAYVKRRELIMNEPQQERAKRIYGSDIFQRIGIPGFAGGGLIGNTPPQVVNPNRQTSTQQQFLKLDPNDLMDIKNYVRAGAMEGAAIGSEKGSEKGMFTATDRSEKLKQLEKDRVV